MIDRKALEMSSDSSTYPCDMLKSAAVAYLLSFVDDPGVILGTLTSAVLGKTRQADVPFVESSDMTQI